MEQLHINHLSDTIVDGANVVDVLAGDRYGAFVGLKSISIWGGHSHVPPIEPGHRTICIFTHGEGTIEVNGEEHPVSQARVYILEPDEHSVITADERTAIHVLIITLRIVDE